MSTFRVDLKPPEPRASNLFWLHQIRSQVSRKLMNTLSPATAVIKYQSVWLGSWNSNNSDHKLLMWVQTCQKTMNTSYTVPTTDLAGFAWFCYILFLGWPWGQQNPKSGSSTDAQVVDLDDALGSTNFMQNPQAAEAPKKNKIWILVWRMFGQWFHVFSRVFVSTNYSFQGWWCWIIDFHMW